MKKKVYHLGTCSTCVRINKEVGVDESFEQKDIKQAAITEHELDEMKAKAGSYEALFSRRAMKYRAMGLHEMKLSEADYKNHILKEYTFLKRPVFLIGDDIFVGNSKKTVEAVKSTLETK